MVNINPGFQEAPTIKTIYLAEDEIPVRILATRVLERAGYKVYPFETGNALLENILKTDKPPDLIVLDISLPGLSGIEVLYKLKSTENLAHISVIMLTANQDTGFVKEAYLAGANDYLLKPIQPDLLTERARTNLTLSITQTDIPIMINHLHLEEPSLLQATGMREFSRTHRCYPILYKNVQLCFVVPQETRPKAFLNVPFEVIKSNARIFRKTPVRWNQIWPPRALSSGMMNDLSSSKSSSLSQSPAQAGEGGGDGPLLLSLSPHLSKEAQDLKKIAYGKLNNVSITLWKSLLKWTDEKEKFESECQFWREKIKLYSDRFGVLE